MRTIPPHAAETPSVAPGVAAYRILCFATRSAAVRFCLRVGDALEAAPPRASRGITAVWLAAAEGGTTAVKVYASDAAFDAARAAGVEVPSAGRVRSVELPAARCLVLGDHRLIGG